MSKDQHWANPCCKYHSGKYGHECPDWDYLWICKDCPEWGACLCSYKKEFIAESLEHHAAKRAQSRLEDTQWANERIDEIFDADALALVLGDRREKIVQVILEAIARGWIQRGKYE